MRVIVCLLLAVSSSVAFAQTPGADGTPPVASTPARPPAVADSPHEENEPIEDNSFLIEEAYNQEPGVIQHISAFQRMRSGDWLYTFTQEWPVPRDTHQLSVTLPCMRLRASPDGRAAGGDIALNYRYQLAGSGDTKVAVAPRFSVLLPAGDFRQSRGAGAVGYQANVPVSLRLAPAFVTHLNAGVTVTPGSRDPAGDRADTVTWNFGDSLIWLARPLFNVLLELAYTSGEAVVGPRLTTRARTFFVNPGVRWAMNFKSGLQIVPGVALPIGIGSSAGERALFLYLSFEHPLWKAR